MKTKTLSIIILSFGIIFSAAIIGNALAQVDAGNTAATAGTPNIQFPVKELGNCKDETACRAYCDKPENMKPCLAFAEKNNLISPEELKRAKKFMDTGAKGPGGCRGRDECDAYCNNIDHIDECISFAEKNNLIPPEELAEAKKVQAAIKRGVKPPACSNKKECDVYCEAPEHMEECINFGTEAGFIQGKELEDAQKMLAALKRGVKPPPCKGKQACDEYCQNPNNMEACMNFAIEAGFMDEKQKEDSQKMLQAIKKGVKPPACRGKDECDVYCQSEEHMEECINFAEAAGFMDAKQAEMSRKTKGKGPGDCKGREECEAFCNNPDNQETCFQFGKEHGMIPEEDLKRMEEGKGRFKEDFNRGLEQAPQEVRDCLTSAIGSENLEKFKSGTAMPPRELGDQMRTCFEKFGMPPGQPGQKCEGENCPPPGQGQPGQGGQIMGPGQTGPGGCKTPEECKAYCESNPEECQNQKFQPGPGATTPGGQMMPEQAGPGGCKGPEECKAYCESNPEQCKNFQPGQPGQGQPGQPGQGGMAPGTFPNAPGNVVCEDPTKCPQGPSIGGQGFGAECKDNPEKCKEMQQKMIAPQEGQQLRQPQQGGQPGQQPGQFGQPGQDFQQFKEIKPPMELQPGQPGQPGQQINSQPGQQIIGPQGQGGTIQQPPQGIQPPQDMQQQLLQQQPIQQPAVPSSGAPAGEQPSGTPPPPPPSGGETSPPPSGSIQKQSLFGTISNLFKLLIGR